MPKVTDKGKKKDKKEKKQTKPQRPDKELFKQIIKEMNDYFIENLLFKSNKNRRRK